VLLTIGDRPARRAKEARLFHDLDTAEKDTLMSDYLRIRERRSERKQRWTIRLPPTARATASARLQPRSKTRSTSAWRPEQVPVPTHTN
jgi:hypothetical protein